MGQNRKVLVLTHLYPRWEGDSIGVSLRELVEQLGARQFNVIVIAPHFAGAPTLEKANYLEIHRFRYAPANTETLGYSGSPLKQGMQPLRLLKLVPFMISFALKSLELVNREKPDVVFTHGIIPSAIVGWLVSIVRGKKLYVMSLGADIDLFRQSGVLRSLVRLIYRRCAKTFVESSYLRETALDLDLATPAKIEVCPLPARTDLFGKQPVLERFPPLILAVAQFSPRKQLHVLVNALEILQNDDIDFVCEIYGEGDCEIELRTLIAKSNLQDRVWLKTRIPQAQLAKSYPSARITVLPAINEGFALTLVEAQLSGSAVIGARSGGILDIIHDRETGLLFEPGNAEQLAAQIRSLLTDDQLYRDLITNAKRDAERRFSPEVIAAWYEQALGLALRE